MPGEFYFMALGGLGVSLAGFAGLIAAFDRRPDARSAVAAWRLRNIVVGGFIITFAGFGTVALYTVTQHHLALTVRLVSLGLVAIVLVRLPFESRSGPAWPDERQRRSVVITTFVVLFLTLANVVFADLGFLQILFLGLLVGPVSIFINTVREVARDTDSDPGSGQGGPPET